MFGARWSSAGTRVAYTSTTLSLAMTGFLAHVNVADFDPDDPRRSCMSKRSCPNDRHAPSMTSACDSPRRWRDVPAPASSAAVGDAWAASAASLALIVPSVHVPIETPERERAHQSARSAFAASPSRFDGSHTTSGFCERAIRSQAGAGYRRSSTLSGRLIANAVEPVQDVLLIALKANGVARRVVRRRDADQVHRHVVFAQRVVELPRLAERTTWSASPVRISVGVRTCVAYMTGESSR